MSFSLPNLNVDLASLLTELQSLGDKAPQVLTALSAALDKLQSDAAAVTPFLQKFFPNVATLEPKVAADIKVVIDFLSKWEPVVLPYVLDAVAVLSKVLPMAATAPKLP